MLMDGKPQLVFSLHDIGAIKFGAYKLKSGIISPFYLDLRILVSYPRVLRETAQMMAQLLATLKFDRIAAIPYAALPIGTAVALEMDRPLIYPRREKKDYGTGHAVEGEYRAGETVVVIDDVITTGASKLEAIGPLALAKLKVRDIVVLVDREQGGAQEIAKRGYQIHAVFKITEMLRFLEEAGKVTESQHREVLTFLKQNGVPS
jgi:orotate phosphoribosyltransferase